MVYNIKTKTMEKSTIKKSVKHLIKYREVLRDQKYTARMEGDTEHVQTLIEELSCVNKTIAELKLLYIK